MNAINFISRIEEDGLRLYDKLAYETADPELKEIFGLLADRQKCRLETLEALRENVSPTDADSMFAERTRPIGNGFRRLLDSKDILHELKNDRDGFFHILKAEEETIGWLDGMAKAESRMNTRVLLERMAADERAHLATIENIYDFIEAPHAYLEWGEFSNLRPL